MCLCGRVAGLEFLEFGGFGLGFFLGDDGETVSDGRNTNVYVDIYIYICECQISAFDDGL